MAYLPNIPQGTDKVKQSRPQIQTNFADIQDWTAVDHQTFGTNFEGTHSQVTLIAGAATSAPAAGQVQLNSQVFAASGIPELYFRNGTTGLDFPISAANASAAGYTALPGGLIMKWGNATLNTMGGGPFAFIWPTAGNQVPFSQQYAAWVVVGAVSNPAQDVNAVAYVTDIASSPLAVVYTIWRRNQVGVAGTDHPPFDVWALAIGIP